MKLNMTHSTIPHTGGYSKPRKYTPIAEFILDALLWWFPKLRLLSLHWPCPWLMILCPTLDNLSGSLPINLQRLTRCNFIWSPFLHLYRERKQLFNHRPTRTMHSAHIFGTKLQLFILFFGTKIQTISLEIITSRIHGYSCAQSKHYWKGYIELRGEMYTFRLISNYVDLLMSGLWYAPA